MDSDSPFMRHVINMVLKDGGVLQSSTDSQDGPFKFQCMFVNRSLKLKKKIRKENLMVFAFCKTNNYKVHIGKLLAFQNLNWAFLQ